MNLITCYQHSASCFKELFQNTEGKGERGRGGEERAKEKKEGKKNKKKIKIMNVNVFKPTVYL